LPRRPEAGASFAELLRSAAADLRRAGIEDGASEARLLLMRATGRSRERLVAEPDARPTAVELATFMALLERRLQREPMAYILGEREFWGLPFKLAPGVLIPRPETETLIEPVLELFPVRQAALRILDMGVGSGCLLLTLLHLYPEARGVGTDVAAEALAVARINARRLGVATRARFRCTGWGRGLRGPFDLIVSNPPYVAEAEFRDLAPEVREFEPRAALAGGADGLEAYRALAPEAGRLLAPGGRLVLEIGRGQGDAVAAILADRDLVVIERRVDLAGIERCLVAMRRED
jgi:release factor glutamine methyltransferase